MARGLGTLQEFINRKPKESIESSAQSTGWTPEAVNSFFKGGAVTNSMYANAPQIEQIPIKTPEPTPTLTDRLKGGYESFKQAVLPVLGGAAESLGKPIARGINILSGADTGLSQEQLNRKYGMQRLLGQEPTSLQQFGYGIGSTLPMLAGGGLLAKAGTGMLSQAALGAGGSAISTFGAGGSGTDVAKSAAVGAAYMPGLQKATQLSTGLLGKFAPNLAPSISAGISEFAGGLGGTATTIPVRLATGQGMPTAQEFGESAFSNLLVGRGMAGYNRLTASPTIVPPVLAQETPINTPPPVETPSVVIKPITLKGKLKPSDANYRSAVENWNETIDNIKNRFGTNELRANEQAIVQPELDAAMSRLEQSTFTMPKSDQNRLKLAAGLGSDTVYNALGKLKTDIMQQKTYEMQLNDNLNNFVNNIHSDIVKPEIKTTFSNAIKKLQTENWHIDTDAVRKSIETKVKEGKPITQNDIILDLQKFSSKTPPTAAKRQKQYAEAIAAPVLSETDGNFRIRSRADKDPTSFDYKVRNAMQKMLDSKWSIAKVAEVAKDNHLKNLAYNMAHNDNIAQRIIFENTVDLNGNVTGNSLKSVFNGLTNKQIDDFMQYQYHKHNIDRVAQGKPIDNNITADMSKAKITEWETANPELKNTSAKWNDFKQNLMKTLMVDNGLISEDSFNSMLKANPNYISTLREGYATSGDVLKATTGSVNNRRLLNGVESMVETVQKFVSAASKQRLLKQLYDDTLKNPNELSSFLEILPTEVGETKTIKTMEGLDNYVEDITRTQEPNDIAHGRIKNVIIDGKIQRMRIKDELLFESLDKMPETQKNKVLNVLKSTTTMAKMLITTYNPLFAVVNLIRDLPSGFINSRTTNNPVKYLADYLGAAMDVITNRPIYQDYLNMGAGGQIAQAAGAGGVKTANVAKQLVKQTDIVSKFIDSSKTLLHNVEKLNNAVESASRLAEYKRNIKKYGSDETGKQQALHAADEVTVNFFKKGSAASVAFIDAQYPYFNAALQGLNNARSQLAENPVGAIAKASATLTIPSILSYLILNDDPEYQKLDQRIKDDFLIVPFKNKDGIYPRIPLPREFATPFHTIPIRMLDAIKHGDPEKFYRDIVPAIMRQYSPINPMTGHILAPILQTYGNPEGRDWLGKPILNRTDLTVEPSMQYDETTSGVAKGIGSLTGMSPKKLDAIGSSYLGGISQITRPLTSETGSVGNIMKRKFSADPIYNTTIVTDHYNAQDKLQTQIATLKKREQPIPIELTQRLRKMTTISDNISDLRKIKGKIIVEKPLTPRENAILSRFSNPNINTLDKEGKTREIQRSIVDLASSDQKIS